jgi:hypothetical protein
MDGFYATAHNPSRLTDNLRHTRLFVTVGSGAPEPGVESSPSAIAAGGLVELELRQHAEEFVRVAHESGADVTYRPEMGVHDWPYWRRHLAEAIEWGLFRPVQRAPRRWTYRTVATRSAVWSLRYRFEAPPAQLIEISRDRGRLRAAGSGRVRIRNASGCGFTATVPFDRALPRCGRSTKR